MRYLRVVEAKDYNLDFWNLKEIKFGNVTIFARPDFREIREEVRRGEDNVYTGTVRVNVNDKLTPEEAIEYTVEELHDFEILLSFAQNRDVFFNEYECFKIEENLKKSLIKEIRSIRTGKKKRIPIIRQWGIEDFIKTGIPLLRNDDYNKKTGIKRALHFWVESCLFTPTVIEVDHALNFSALEVVANAHVDNNPKTFLFSEQIWDEISDRFRQLFDDLGIKGDSRSRLLGSLMFPKQGSIKEKISYFLESIGLPKYEFELSQITDLRHDILHGHNIEDNYKGDDPMEVVLKGIRLLEKIILNLLNFYHRKDVIHGAYLREDLRARI